MYGLFLQSLGYAKDLDLSELEIGLEEKGQLGCFEEVTRGSSRRTGPPRKAKWRSRSRRRAACCTAFTPRPTRWRTRG
jgi:hypothetical protein